MSCGQKACDEDTERYNELCSLHGVKPSYTWHGGCDYDHLRELEQLPHPVMEKLPLSQENLLESL